MKKKELLLLFSSLLCMTGCGNVDTPTDSTSKDHPDDIPHQSQVVRTRIPYSETQLPHFLSLEVEKAVDLDQESFAFSSLFGHTQFMDNECVFGEFLLNLEEASHCSFYLEMNINDEKKIVLQENISYLTDDYLVTVSDSTIDEAYQGTLVTYQKENRYSIDSSQLTYKDKGFFNVSLFIVKDDTNYIVVHSSIFYRIAEDQIIFGLSENPVLTEKDEGSFGCGWKMD